MAMCKTVITIDDQEIFCYGDVRTDSNFAIACDDEANDGFYADGNPADPDNGFQNWTQAAKYLYENYSTDIAELTAC